MVWFNRHVAVPQLNSVHFPEGSWEGTGLREVPRGRRDCPACPGLTAAPWPTSPWFLQRDPRGEAGADGVTAGPALLFPGLVLGLSHDALCPTS